MKKLFTLLLIFFLVGALSAQETLWKQYKGTDGRNYSASIGTSGAVFTSDGTWFSETFALSGKEDNAFTGLWGVAVQLDSIAGDVSPGGGASPDTVLFFPEIWMGRTIGWITGDTMTFYERGFDENAGFLDTVKVFIDSRDHGKTFYWVSDPEADYSLWGFPYMRMRIKMVVKGYEYLGETYPNVGIKQEVTYVSYVGE